MTYPSNIFYYIINIFEVPCPLCEMLYCELCNDIVKGKFLLGTWPSQSFQSFSNFPLQCTSFNWQVGKYQYPNANLTVPQTTKTLSLKLFLPSHWQARKVQILFHILSDPSGTNWRDIRAHLCRGVSFGFGQKVFFTQIFSHESKIQGSHCRVLNTKNPRENLSKMKLYYFELNPFLHRCLYSIKAL